MFRSKSLGHYDCFQGCCGPCLEGQELYPSDGGTQQVLLLQKLLQQLHPVPKTFLLTWIEQHHKQQCPHLHSAQLQANDPSKSTQLFLLFIQTMLCQMLPGVIQIKFVFMMCLVDVVAKAISCKEWLRELPRDPSKLAQGSPQYCYIRCEFSWGDLEREGTGWLKHLLQHLPLLQPQVGVPTGDCSASNTYLHVLPRIVEAVVEQEGGQGPGMWEDVQQLLTYAFLHPAFSVDEKRKQSLCPPDMYSNYTTPQHAWDAWPYCKQDSLNVNSHNRVRRSNSLTPPSEVWQTGSECHLNGGESPQLRSSSLSSFQVDGSGMKDVPSWLKSLRLHKYAGLFAQMAYETMLNLTEEQLESQGVTKGARHKIALSIQRLRERPHLLLKLEKEVMETGNIQNALTELKTLLASPIKPHSPPDPGFSSFLDLDSALEETSRTSLSSEDVSKDASDIVVTGNLISPPTVIVSAAPDSDSGHEGSETSDPEHEEAELARKAVGEGRDRESVLEKEDLPGQIARLLGKICTQLLVSQNPSEDNVSQFLALLERCLGHEAFALHQKKRLASWKEQAHRLWRNMPVRKLQDPRFNRRWSNVAHYPGFYADLVSTNQSYNANTRAATLASKYGRNPGFNNAVNQSSLAPPKARPLAATQSFPLSNHRNSFCVSTLGTLNTGVNQGLGLTSLGGEELLYRHRASLEDSLTEVAY
nr:EOG090X06H8 [Lepidurus arcticus]